MSSRRLPLTVYSVKRRQRSISNPHSRPVPSSSPLKSLAHDADITVEEMSRRMMKRSRSDLKRSYSGSDPFKSASVGASPVDQPLEDRRPAKRSKASVRAPLQTIVEPSLIPVEEEGTADMDLTDVAQLKTPVPKIDTAEKQNDYTANEESDFLSPLPSSRLAKRVIAHRTSSSNLAENRDKRSTPSSNRMLLSPASSDLASPFHSRPGSPNPDRYAVKNALKKKLNRTRSVGTDLRRRATMRSFSRAVSPASNASSPGARRHPSLPSSQSGQKENQDWLVPARFKQPVGQATPRRSSDTSVPFVRESSFFDSVPEACSTPVHAKRNSMMVPPTPGRDIDATPRVPLGLHSSAAFAGNNFFLNEPTPRARPSVGTVASALFPTEDSLFPDSPTIPSDEPTRGPPIASSPLNARRRLTAHMSKDSIFSSVLDFSTSVADVPPVEEALGISDKTRVDPMSVTLVPPSSPMAAHMSPSSSEGDELRDMFSILGLDEDEHWFTSPTLETSLSRSTVPSSASTAGRPKKTKSSMSARKSNTTQGTVSVKARAARTGAQAPASSASQAQNQRRRVLIMEESPRPLEPLKTPAMRKNKARPTIKMRILDKPIQATSDSSDEINFLKGRNVQSSASSD